MYKPFALDPPSWDKGGYYLNEESRAMPLHKELVASRVTRPGPQLQHSYSARELSNYIV